MSISHIRAVIFDIGGVVARSPLIAIAAYEAEKGLPKDYINCAITSRGPNGAWQRFERGELSLFPFYLAFGQELSDTANCNAWFTDYCKRRNLDYPELPKVLNVDGRELFGRMMREGSTLDENVVRAIRRIRDEGRWRVIALTNNFSKLGSTRADLSTICDVPDVEAAAALKQLQERHPDVVFDAASELAFLGWGEGIVPPLLRALFDDFCDSSTLGMRKPEQGIYLLACKRNDVKPHECVFLDDLGMNLKAARDLGMETIHVPIGGALGALRRLGEVLGINLELSGQAERVTVSAATTTTTTRSNAKSNARSNASASTGPEDRNSTSSTSPPTRNTNASSGRPDNAYARTVGGGTGTGGGGGGTGTPKNKL